MNVSTTWRPTKQRMWAVQAIPRQGGKRQRRTNRFSTYEGAFIPFRLSFTMKMRATYPEGLITFAPNTLYAGGTDTIAASNAVFFLATTLYPEVSDLQSRTPSSPGWTVFRILVHTSFPRAPRSGAAKMSCMTLDGKPSLGGPTSLGDQERKGCSEGARSRSVQRCLCSTAHPTPLQ